MTNIPERDFIDESLELTYLADRAALASRLRELRLEAGLTGQELAKLTGISQSKISKLENEKVIPNVEDVSRLAEKLKVSDEVRADLVARVQALMTEFNSWRVLHRRGLRWKQEQFLELEARSRVVRIFQPALIPGLLQTAAYAREVLEIADFSGRGDIDEALKTRLARQEILYDETKTFKIVVTEAALRSRFASRAAMATQIGFIHSLSLLENVAIKAIPFSQRLPIVPYNSFCVFDDEAVTAETFSVEMFVREPSDISFYKAAFGLLEKVALDEEGTRKLLDSIADSLRRRTDEDQRRAAAVGD